MFDIKDLISRTHSPRPTIPTPIDPSLYLGAPSWNYIKRYTASLGHPPCQGQDIVKRVLLYYLNHVKVHKKAKCPTQHPE